MAVEWLRVSISYVAVKNLWFYIVPLYHYLVINLIISQSASAALVGEPIN